MLWLFKEDPETYSFDLLTNEGKTLWEGVHNNLALIHLRQVREGDKILYYETGDKKSVVGIMKASEDARSLDDNAHDIAKSKQVAVEVVPIRRLARPVSLSEIKASPKFRDFALVKISRLSVLSVSRDQWDEILKMSEDLN